MKCITTLYINNGLRLRRTNSKKPKIDYHKKEKFDIQGCTTIVTRMSCHLKDVHNILTLEQLEMFGAAAGPSSSQTSPWIASSQSDFGILIRCSAIRWGLPTSIWWHCIWSECIGKKYLPSEDEDDMIPRISLTKLMAQFSKYLANPLGKELDNSAIKQYIYLLEILIHFSNSQNIRNLLKIAVINNIFQSLKLSKKKGGKDLLRQTLRRYTFSSIKHLIYFLKSLTWIWACIISVLFRNVEWTTVRCIRRNEEMVPEGIMDKATTRSW